MMYSRILSVGWLSHVRTRHSPKGNLYGSVLYFILTHEEFPSVTLLYVTRRAAIGIEEVFAVGRRRNKKVTYREMRKPAITKNGKHLRYAVTIMDTTYDVPNYERATIKASLP